MAAQLVGVPAGDEGGDDYEAAVARGQLRPGPYVAEEHLVGELDEFGGEVCDEFLGRVCSVVSDLLNSFVSGGRYGQPAQGPPFAATAKPSPRSTGYCPDPWWYG